jgi:ElaB/YqjD/DUF883 family membrane-anchored ribosome-binding protein
MAKRSKSSSDDVAAVEELMQDLEARLRRLNTKSKSDDSDATDDIGDFVSATLGRIAAQVRNTADAATDSLEDDATKAGTDILRKIWDEMERRPLLTLALAAGAGYLLGLVGKQAEAE